MQREAIHTAVDLGTTKACTLVARQGREGDLEVIGVGVVPSAGVQKGSVVHLHEAREAVTASLAEAARSAGVSIAWVHLGVGGAHIQSSTRWGTVYMPHPTLPIHRPDIERALEAAYPQDLPPEREVLHLLPRSFALDGQRGVRNPVGMHASRLDVEAVTVTGATTAVQALLRALESARVRVRSVVVNPLASGEAVLSREEREMGAVVVDIGGGTTDVALFQGGTLAFARTLPLGGNHFTHDLAVALGTPTEVAEEVKRRYGHLLPEHATLEPVEVPAFGDGRTARAERRDIVRVLKERARQLFELVYLALEEAGLRRLPPAGLVLTGGASRLPGLTALARQLFQAPARLGTPSPLPGLPADLQGPELSTAVGVLVWGARHLQQRQAEAGRPKARNGGLASKVTGWLRAVARG